MSDTEGPAPDAATIEQAEVRIRRAPKVPVFLVLGALVGAIVTVIVTSAFPADPTVGYLPTVGYFLLYGVPIGIVLGAVVAIILDRVSSRRAKNIVVERTIVDPLPDEFVELDRAQELPEAQPRDS